MSKQIDRLIADLAEADMGIIRKMTKVEIIKLTEALVKENYRELHNDTIVEMYEERFSTQLVRV